MGAPKLRFKGFSDEWADTTLSDLLSIFNGYAFSSSQASDEGILWVKIADIGIQCMRTENLSYLPREFFNKYQKFVLHEGDYVVALTRPILNGKLKIARINKFFDGALLNQRVGKIVSKHNHSFIFSYLQKSDIISQIDQTIAGTDPPNLSPTEISSIPVFVPSKVEQQKIAQFLTSVDEKINLLKKKKDLLEQYKKGVMQKIFSQELRFKDDEGKDFPEWEVKKLGEVFTHFKGNGLSKDKLVTKGQYPCILYGELYTTYKEQVFEIKSSTDTQEGLASKKGDLLMPNSTTTTGIDLANFTALNFENVLLGGDITVLRALQDVSNVFYAYYFSNYMKYELAGYSQGSTIIHLYYSHIKNLEIKLPSITEQQKIADFLSVIDDKTALVEQQINKTELWKKGLLQQMFV